MLKIREEQWKALCALREQQFAARAREHLAQYFPARCAELGEEAIGESIEDAVRRSKAIGLVRELDVLRFLNHMYALAPDFDTNPAFPWAGKILADLDLDPATRMDQLSARSSAELADRRKADGA